MTWRGRVWRVALFTALILAGEYARLALPVTLRS